MTTFDIEIVSDAVCPWVRVHITHPSSYADRQQCYIGYRRLQKAITMYRKTYPDGSKDTFNITWKPYFLDENPPATPVPRWGKSCFSLS